jgi:hypothetical protein
MEIASGLPSPLVRTREALYGNYLQRTCNRPDAALKQERFSVKISKFSVAQFSARKAQVRRPYLKIEIDF